VAKEKTYIIRVLRLRVRSQNLERLFEGVVLFLVVGNDDGVDNIIASPRHAVCVKLRVNIPGLASGRGAPAIVARDEGL
jgi:hypothetical protein